MAVVTGAARGIGRATAVDFARQGADLVGIDICAPHLAKRGGGRIVTRGDSAHFTA